MANKTNLSKLWKTEDWLAVWIGFIVIAIGLVAVLTKAFDFSALTFKTWTWGEALSDTQMAKIVPLGQQFASGAFWIKLLRTVLVLGVLFTVGAALTGEKVKKFVPAFLVVFVLSVIVRLISAEFTLNRYLEWAFWALIVGMLVSNTVGTPKWLNRIFDGHFFLRHGADIEAVLFGILDQTNGLVAADGDRIHRTGKKGGVAKCQHRQHIRQLGFIDLEGLLSLNHRDNIYILLHIFLSKCQ